MSEVVSLAERRAVREADRFASALVGQLIPVSVRCALGDHDDCYACGCSHHQAVARG